MITRSDKIALGAITTRDSSGKHFREIYADAWIDAMEQSGYLTIHRPVHSTGLHYSEDHWTVEVAAEVADWFDANGELV